MLFALAVTQLSGQPGLLEGLKYIEYAKHLARRGRWARVLKCRALIGQKLFTPLTRRLLWLKGRIILIVTETSELRDATKCVPGEQQCVQVYLTVKMRTEYKKRVRVGRSVLAHQGAPNFWCLVDTEKYKDECTAIMKIGCLFGSTYLCESASLTWKWNIVQKCEK